MSDEQKKIATQAAQFPLEAQANAERLEALAYQNEATSEKDLAQQRANSIECIDQLNRRLEEVMQRRSAVHERLANKGPRDTEAARIAELEETLLFKTEHCEELTRTFQECKRKIAVQETAYNYRFGLTPSVAVLRPGTAASVKMGHLSGRASRPLTAGPICRVVGINRRRESLRYQTF
jgi:K+/H+ antiporter YhaU regulatory subunit KhtT